MDKKLSLKLNGGRAVSGILRGFDPFMNVVIDETIEECKDGSKNNIGMVVSYLFSFLLCLYVVLKLTLYVVGNQRK
jgi:small nuclear ribonucleoprotein (snRNP)-like protein